MLCLLHSNCCYNEKKQQKIKELGLIEIEDIYVLQFHNCKLCNLLYELFGAEYMLGNFIVWYIKNFIYGEFCNVISANYIIGTTYDYIKKNKINKIKPKLCLKDSINYWKEIYKLK